MNAGLEPFFTALAGEDNLTQFVKDRREEDLYLEFKQKVDSRNGDIADGDRIAFSKTVSGFANADGGVLIFGIETKHTRDHPDRASRLKPITNAERFRAKLLDSVVNTAQPAVRGIRVELIPAAAGEGYVKCLVPASDMPPHRAMHAQREYWRRTTTGFLRMEHDELEDAFGRRLRPVLSLVVSSRKIQHFSGSQSVELQRLDFHFNNEGRGVARHAGMICKFTDATVAEARDGLADLAPYSVGYGVTFYNPTGVVHPNGLSSFLGCALVRKTAPGPLKFEAIWYAENAATTKKIGAIADDEVLWL